MNHIDPLAISFAAHPLHPTILEHVITVLATHDQATLDHTVELMRECGCDDCLETITIVSGGD